MTGQEVAALVHGMTSGKPIAGFSVESAIIQTIEEVWAIDTLAHLREGALFSTVASQTLYTFAEVFGAAESQVRTCRGIYDASLSLSGDFDQRQIMRRVYSGRETVLVDNIARTIQFVEDPGETDEQYRADYYLASPIYAATDELPVLPGWHHRLIVNGALAYWEMLRDRKPGTFRQLFEGYLVAYQSALESGSGLAKYSKIEGVQQPRVKLR